MSTLLQLQAEVPHYQPTALLEIMGDLNPLRPLVTLFAWMGHGLVCAGAVNNFICGGAR